MSRGRTIGVVCGVLAVLTIFVVAGARRKGGDKGKEVQFEAIEPRRIEAWVRAPGDLEPTRLVQISSNVLGRVEQLSVREGERVTRGQFLLRLDDERYVSAGARTRARLDAAQAALEMARANSALATETVARKRKLNEQRLISPEELSRAENEAEVAALRLKSSLEEVREVQAAMEEAGKDVRETVFSAPMDGIVTSINIEQGENVVTGTMNNAGTVLLTIADLDTMEVIAEVDETDVVKLEAGQRAKVLVDALPDTTLRGEVSSIGQSGLRANDGTGQAIHFRVKVRVIDPPASLRPGMSADVEVLAGERQAVTSVPIQALVAYPERVLARWERARERREHAGTKGKKAKAGDDVAEAADSTPPSGTEAADADTSHHGRETLIEGVFVERKGEAKFVRVKLGLRGDSFVEISGDFQEKDRVIAGPYRVLRQLKDGEKVREMKAERGKKDSDRRTDNS